MQCTLLPTNFISGIPTVTQPEQHKYPLPPIPNTMLHRYTCKDTSSPTPLTANFSAHILHSLPIETSDNPHSPLRYPRIPLLMPTPSCLLLNPPPNP